MNSSAFGKGRLDGLVRMRNCVACVSVVYIMYAVGRAVGCD